MRGKDGIRKGVGEVEGITPAYAGKRTNFLVMGTNE